MMSQQRLTVKDIFVALQYILKWLSSSSVMMNLMLHAFCGWTGKLQSEISQ